MQSTTISQPLRFHATIDAIRTDLAMHFETMTDAEVVIAGQAALIDYGATHIQPQTRSYQKRHGQWGQDWHEITMLGVFAQGSTMAEALRDWTRNAVRMHLAAEEGVFS